MRFDVLVIIIANLNENSEPLISYVELNSLGQDDVIIINC